MTPEELQLLKELVNLPHYAVFKKAVFIFLEELKDVNNIDETKDIAQQALGRKYATQSLLRFLSSMGILDQPVKEKNQTYE